MGDPEIILRPVFLSDSQGFLYIISPVINEEIQDYKMDIKCWISKDSGLTFNHPIIVAENVVPSTYFIISENFVAVAIDNNDIIYVVWGNSTEDHTYTKLFLSKSIDGNDSFVHVSKIYEGSHQIAPGSIILGDEKQVYVVWAQSLTNASWIPGPHENSSTFIQGDTDILFAKSLDDGKSFSNPITVNTYKKGIQSSPSMTFNHNGQIVIGWMSWDIDLENITYFPETFNISIILSKSTNEGNTFVGDLVLKNKPVTPMQVFLDIEVDKSGNVYLTWSDSSYGWENPDIYFIAGKLEDITVPYDYTPIVVGGVVATAALCGIVGVGLTEAGKYGGSMLFLPMYTRLKKGKLMDNFLRGQIFGIIREIPGVNYNHIKRTLEVGNGGLAYHLQTLEREGFIYSERKNTRTFFYPTKLPKRFEVLEDQYPLGEEINKEMVLGTTQQAILKLIKMENGITQGELKSRLNLSNQNINYNVKRLVDLGLVIAVKADGQVQCFISEEPREDEYSMPST
jgi:hypothetical protein